MALEVLGSEDNRAYIYDRLGQAELLELPAESVEYNRALCEVSRSTIVVAPSKCTPGLSEIHPWAHSLVIQRAGRRVWEGPVRKVTHGRAGMTILGSDVAGWMERRLIRTARALTGTVMGELAWTVAQAFAPDNPNVTQFVQSLAAGGGSILRDVKIGADYHHDDLGSIVSAGGRWTTLGRAILLWHEAHTTGRTHTLVPEDHLLAEVEVVEDGDNLGTLVLARDDNGARASVGATDSYYGLVELGVSVQGTSDVPTLTRNATANRNQAYPAPLSIEVPGDAQVACDAPFPLHQLVPGVQVPVETTTATALKLRGSFILDGVKVTQSAGADEKVGITLAPLSRAVSG